MRLSILSFASILLTGANSQHGIVASITPSCSGESFDILDSSGCTSINAEINTFFVGHEYSELCIGIWYPQKNCAGAGLVGFDATNRGECLAVNGALSVQMSCV
jgi:hypothetical protein